MTLVDPDRRLQMLILGERVKSADLGARMVERGHSVAIGSRDLLALIQTNAPRFDAIIVATSNRDEAEHFARSIRRLHSSCARCPILIGGSFSRSIADRYADAQLTINIADAFLGSDFQAALDDIADDRCRMRGLDSSNAVLLDELKIAELRAVFGAAQAGRLLWMADEELALRPRHIRCLIKDDATEIAAREAHALVGAAYNIGAVGVATIAQSFERLPATGHAAIALADAMVAASDATREKLLQI